MTPPAFDDYDVVIVQPTPTLPERLWKAQGVVLGRACEGEFGWSYAVYMLGEDSYWCVDEKFLRFGGKMNMEDIYGPEDEEVRVWS